MSTEPEPTPVDNTDPGLPTDPTPPPAENTPPADTPPPDAPPLPTEPIVFEPFTYYEVTSVCTTADQGDGTPCPNLNTTTTEPMVYSNAGEPVIICGLCGQQRTILAATKLDPQPEVS